MPGSEPFGTGGLRLVSVLVPVIGNDIRRVWRKKATRAQLLMLLCNVPATAVAMKASAVGPRQLAASRNVVPAPNPAYPLESSCDAESSRKSEKHIDAGNGLRR